MIKTLFCNAYESGYLGTRILASYLNRHGYNTHSILINDFKYIPITYPIEQHHGYQAYGGGVVSVNKATFYPITEKDIELLKESVSDYGPDIIGFSARSTNNWLVPILVPAFKEAAPSALLVAGGFGPTLEPDIYLNGGFDCVVQCDGEEAMLEIVQCTERQDIQALKNIQNTVWNDLSGNFKFNKIRPQSKDLSKYGEPLHGDSFFTFIDDGKKYKNYDPTIRSGSYLTYFGRGCIGKCAYCSGGQWSEIYSNNNAKCYKRRNRDVDELLHELKKLPESVKHIWFVDEYFALPSDKAVYFFREYKKFIHKTFFTYLNYYYLLEHTDIFKLIIDAGLSGTGIGFQTGSEKFAKDCYNRDNDNAKLIDYANVLFDNSVYTGIHIIGGNCYETDAILQDTIDLVRRLPFSIECPYMVNIENIRLRPHPKTPITYKFNMVVTNPMPASEWLYRAVLLELARLLDDEQLNEIRTINIFHERPALMNSFYHQLLNERQAEYYNNMINQSIKNEIEWVFYCAGDLYRSQKIFFQSLRPKFFLLDKEYMSEEKSIDGIPVVEVNRYFESFYTGKEKFLIFLGNAWLLKSRLHRLFKISNDDIHCVTRDIFYQGYLK